MISLASLLIEDGVRLPKNGTSGLVRCPFHDDSTASLSVDVDKDVWCCHGCGKRGGIKDWLMEKRGMSNAAAAKVMATDGAPVAEAVAQPKPKLVSFSPGLPKRRIGAHPYRDAAGKVLWVVVRNPKGVKPKCTQWTPVGPGWTYIENGRTFWNGGDDTRAESVRVEKGWIGRGPAKSLKRPLYGLPRLLAANPKQQVMVVEGEKCVETVARTFPAAVVTTWCGGSALPKEPAAGKSAPIHLTDWSPIYGRPVLLVSDEDEVGRDVMRAAAELLAPHCSKIRIVLSPGETKDDIHDWIERAGADGARAKLAELATDAPRPTTSPAESPGAKEPPPPIQTDGIESNGYFRVLGNVGDHVAVLLSTYRMLLCSRSSLTQSSALVSLADYQWWLAKTNRDNLTGPVCQQIGSVLIRAADDLGQIDPSQFLGRGCFMHEGSAAWHLGDRLLIDGKGHGLGDLPGVVPVAGPRIPIAEKAATMEARKRVARAVLRYRWEDRNHGKRFLGWIVAAAVGGALDWRPHMWLSAPASTGKSYLLERITQPILRSLLVLTGDPTAAGLARAVGSDAIAVVFDEAEATAAQLDAVLDLARLASGGKNSRIRANQGGGGYQTERPRFSLLLSSVTVARMTHANASRICSVRLSSAGVTDWPTVDLEIRAALEDPDRFLAAVVRDAGEIVKRAKEMEQYLVQDGVDSRQSAIAAALSAGWEWWSGETESIMEAQEDEDADLKNADAVDLLRYLLGIRLRHGVDDKSVARILRERDQSGVARDYGFRLAAEDDVEVLLLAPRHPSLVGKLGRKWTGVDLQRTLLQIAGVERGSNPVSFGAVRSRPVRVPRAVCEELGVGIFDREQPNDMYGEE